MDSKGRLWIAGGRTKDRLPHESAAKFKGGIYVLSAEGKQLDFIPIPVDEVTNCAFGGPDLKTLYLTTARHRHTDAQLAAEPLAGAVLALEPGVTGLPGNRFAG